MIEVNKVVLVGRLTKDIELRKTPSNVSVCDFTVAINRRFNSSQNGEKTADFINCTAWRQSADFLASYAGKGTVVDNNLLTGMLKVRLEKRPEAAPLVISRKQVKLVKDGRIKVDKKELDALKEIEE